MGGKLNAKQAARRYVLQALYQWQLSKDPVEDVIQQFKEVRGVGGKGGQFFCTLVQGTVSELDQVDALLSPALQRSIHNLDQIEQAILRMATYELLAFPDTPHRVIINEAIELTKKFGAEQGHKFVNGVLDKVAHQLRGFAVDRTA